MATLTAKYKPYPAYRSSGVEWLDDVPAHWEVRRLRTFAHGFNNGTTSDQLQNGESAHLVSRIETISNGTVNYARVGYLSEDSDYQSYLLKTDDFLISHINSFQMVGNSARYRGERPLIHGMNLIRITPHKSVFAVYLEYALKSECFIGSMRRVCKPAINQVSVTTSAIKAIHLPLPPLPEQRAIAEFLDRETARVEALIAKKERLIELLQEKRAALISHAVTRGLDPNVPMRDSGVEWLGEIPAHWEVKRLKEVGEAETGLTYSPNDVVDEELGVLVLRASNIFGGKIVYHDNVYVRRNIPEKLITKVGDILVCSRSGSRELIGKNAIIGCDASGMTFGAFMTVFRSPDYKFLHHVFNSALFDFQSGMFSTSTINQLTLGMLNEFRIPLPTATEQAIIVNFLDREIETINALIAKISEALGRLKELRVALVSAAVTGEIDVREESK